MVIKMAKRQDYISWDEYFMGISLLSCLRSKDPNTQVGACIVNGDNHIVSVGYNGLPRGCSDDEYPWDRTADAPNKTKYVPCGAERHFERRGQQSEGLPHLCGAVSLQ